MLDEVCVVEMTVDEERRTLHIFDRENAVSPSYHFVDKRFVLTDDFQKMAQVCIQKKILLLNNGDKILVEEWLQNIRIYFYTAASTVRLYQHGNINQIDMNESMSIEQLHIPYMKRMKNP